MESNLVFCSGECWRFGDLRLTAVTKSTGGLVRDGFQGPYPGSEAVELVVRGTVHSVALRRLQPVVDLDEGFVRSLEQSHGGELRDVVGDLNDHVPIGFVDPLDVHSFQSDGGELLLSWEGEELLEGGDVGRCGCHFWFHKLVKVCEISLKVSCHFYHTCPFQDLSHLILFRIRTYMPVKSAFQRKCHLEQIIEETVSY